MVPAQQAVSLLSNWSVMARKRIRALVFHGLATGSLLIPHHAYATAITMADITFSNLQITPATGSVIFTDPWTAEAFAQANNSLGELDAQFDSSNDTASADALVTWASGHGQANATDLTGTAQSSGNIPGGLAQASSVGRGTLYNSFAITGGMGDVQVDFSIDVSGSLSAFTDASGLSAQSETIFSLELDGTPVLFRDDLLAIGSNSSDARLISETLMGSLTLQFDNPNPYFLLAEADSESTVVNIPEPATVALILTGLVALVGFAKK